MCVSMRLPVRWISNAEIIICDAETTWRVRGETRLQQGQGKGAGRKSTRRAVFDQD